LVQNFFCSLVDTVAAEAMVGRMLGAEFFLFTDNAVAEAAFFKGTSSNLGLFNLVLRLKQLELEYGFILHVLHVSGRRMIQQGMDGLSRGDTTLGVLRVSSMLEFIPLHLSASQRSSALLAGVQHGFHPGLKCCLSSREIGFNEATVYWVIRVFPMVSKYRWWNPWIPPFCLCGRLPLSLRLSLLNN
jgi:hypothetical protein